MPTLVKKKRRQGNKFRRMLVNRVIPQYKLFASDIDEPFSGIIIIDDIHEPNPSTNPNSSKDK